MINFFNLFQTVLAQETGVGTGDAGTSVGSGSAKGIIQDPLKAKSITALLTALLNIVVQVGLPVIALAIVYTGFKYVTAQGNTDKISEAHRALLWTVIGAGVILGALVIEKVVESTVGNLKVNP